MWFECNYTVLFLEHFCRHVQTLRIFPNLHAPRTVTHSVVLQQRIISAKKKKRFRHTKWCIITGPTYTANIAVTRKWEANVKIRRFHAWNETSEEMAFVFCRSENRFELRRVLFKWHHRTTAAGVGSRRLLMVLVWVSTSHQTIGVNMFHPKWCYRRLPAGEICFPSHQD